MSADAAAELDDGLLQSRLVDSGLFAAVHRVASTGSTNEDLLSAADSAAAGAAMPHLTALTAEQQTGGRGRQARSWASPKGTSLSTSLLLRPSLPVVERHWVTLCVGLALVRALRSRGVPGALKWPNDVHVRGRKIAGILAAVPLRDPEAVVVGCGINVLLDEQQLPTPTATSLTLELARAGEPIPLPGTAAAGQLRSALLCDWLEEVAILLEDVRHHGSIEPVRAEILAVISTVGQDVRIELPDGTAVRGAAVAVEHDGALTVEVSGRRRAGSGAGGVASEGLWRTERTPQRESFHAGDVVHLRPLGEPT
ncbi:biotin--[acetyl-CoA-carboxylase] ligase [Nesterenkonia sphaerica]|uniref:Biotin--[acetyl-CoA-carboxylase] ligase n=1 Tax=Nesterenkonia sphaerica TaxID=1804988 RepID=A0A5R9AGN6_9MICC|nr:biotin--[acetyl-CoA-carboxylase] ligase [Nesterenkonia sphaerica]TLP77195.1 biotin--[acetyl-CoA-carboxylase] ligase [Nesterenkonia sphaerica]